MIDDDDDFDLSDAETAREQLPLGLALPVLPGTTLEQAEHNYRMSRNLMPVMFTRPANEEDESSVEVWDDPRGGAEFQRAMDWPRLPTVEEAEAWLRHKVSVAEYAEWQRRYGTKPPK